VPRWDAAKGARSLYEAYLAQELTLKEFEGPRYQRIGHIKKLIADEIVDETLRHRSARRSGRGSDKDETLDPKFAADAAKVSCASCRHRGLVPILDLGRMPRSDGLLKPALLECHESLVPLRLGYCPACSLVQLLETRPPQEMFGEDYYYFSSVSEDLL